jgi:hypothetical protein
MNLTLSTSAETEVRDLIGNGLDEKKIGKAGSTTTRLCGSSLGTMREGHNPA